MSTIKHAASMELILSTTSAFVLAFAATVSGQSTPARLTVEARKGINGTLFGIPSTPGLPPGATTCNGPGGDDTYFDQAAVVWEGGEQKFGKWRQYFNTYEQDWAVTYNAPFQPHKNSWCGRDSGDARANIAAYLRFNVAEGNSGANTFEVVFAPPAAAGTPPDWNAASQFWFFDGRISPSPARPARFRIRGAANMDAVLDLIGHGSVNPLSMELASDGVNRLFKIGQVNRDGLGDISSETNFITIKTDSANVGIGTTAPNAKLQVAGGDIATSTVGSGLIVRSPNGSVCKRIGIDDAGNIVATSVVCP